MVFTLQTQLANIWLHMWPCLSASACTTSIVPFVCVMIKKNSRGGWTSKRGEKNPNATRKWHLLFSFLPLSLFYLVGRMGWGGKLFLSGLWNKCGGGTLRGRCSGCACPCLIRKILGPDWTDPPPPVETPPLWEKLLTKWHERFGNQSILHTAGKCLQNSLHKALIHKFQALLIPALPV